MEAHYPRSRDETGPLPDPSEIKDLCRSFWNLEIADVRRANSRCVFFCERQGQGPVVFRANPGWDGPTHPRTIVQFMKHLSDRGAPCPAVIPAEDGYLYKSVRDLTISIESFLEGEVADRVDCLPEVGEALARVHNASEDFDNSPSKIQDARTYISNALSYCEETMLPPKGTDAVARFGDLMRNTIPELNVRWIFCRGDVRSWNTIADSDYNVRFTDFNSAHFAPALEDVVMVRTQWLMGSQSRQLSDVEMRQFVGGYASVRPQSDEERSAFPFISAAYYGRRLCELHRKWSPNSINRRTWELEDRILALPDVAIQMGEAAIAGLH